MRAFIAAATFLLAGCGGTGQGGEAKGAASTNQIERLSTPEEEKQDPEATVRLQPITLADLDREGMVGAGCDFSREGQMLLASVGSDAVVKQSGEIRHMIHSAPVGPTGGFFEDRHLSISVGRTAEDGAAAGETHPWPARITITNRRAEIQRELRGVWTCGS
jgi:hypothetical protein